MSTVKSSRSRLLMPITSASTSRAVWSSCVARDLHERVELQVARQAEQRPEIAGLERPDHQQHGVRPGRLGLVDLVGVDREVLAQERQVAGAAGLAQVVERAAEMGLLGEHRQGGGAAALVGAHEVGAARSLADRPRRRGAPLVLGDQRRARPGQRLHERAALAAAAGLPLELRERHLVACGARPPGARRPRTARAGCSSARPAPGCGPRSAPPRRARRPSRSTPRPCARPPRASRPSPPRRSRRPRS